MPSPISDSRKGTTLPRKVECVDKKYRSIGLCNFSAYANKSVTHSKSSGNNKSNNNNHVVGRDKYNKYGNCSNLQKERGKLESEAKSQKKEK